MIFYENFANFYDFSTNFCQLADFLPEGGGPRIFVKYSPVIRSPVCLIFRMFTVNWLDS